MRQKPCILPCHTYSLYISPFSAGKDQVAGAPMHCHACRSTQRLLTPAKLHFNLRQKGLPAAAAVAARIAPLTDKNGSWERARRDQLMYVLWNVVSQADRKTDEEGLLLLRRQAVERECDQLFPGAPGCMQRCLLCCCLQSL